MPNTHSAAVIPRFCRIYQSPPIAPMTSSNPSAEKAALPPLRRLADATTATAHLTITDGADGLVVVDDGGLHSTSRGRLLLRIIAMCFDRYLTPAADAAQPRYSRTV